MTDTTDAGVKEIAPTGGIRFPVASRPQGRFSNTQTISILTSNSFQPISLPATGWVRKVAMYFTVTGTAASAGAVVAGDGPFNLISNVTITDATGQPITQGIGGYILSRLNKYFGQGLVKPNNGPSPFNDPMLGPEYAFSATATTFTATFRLDLDFEIDENTGYGCIPNLDSNASLQLKIDMNDYSKAFSGTTVSAVNVSVRISQHYWAPVGSTIGGVAAQTTPIGFGDYLETRYETQTVTASSENIVSVTNRGGLIKGHLIISRNAGTRTAFTAASNVGVVLDNNPVYEGIPLEEWQALLRQAYGYIGTDLTTSYAPLATAGTLPGLDRGVLPIPYNLLSGGRDSWLSTRVGSLLQFKLTPGSGATQLEIVTLIAQVKDAAAFYAPSALT